ncbi:hypothetical protein COU36_01370 [Candidatus Micrarchaeota archaeon CG10_big_fil_rev_8_21_14_0_10_59_7]|nr:MAG: hypothetical protein COU36_01370 [Candidatus Micrarchaeota archaeon CG10_big_fil_rev_8_21_14_0_10_59_7]
MKLGVLSVGVFLLGFAALTSAWTWVGCTQNYTYNGGSEDFYACALNPSGGSEIITNGGYYCLKFAKWYGASTVTINATLYKGSNCGNWVPSDWCYANPSSCSKEFQNGWLGDLGAGNPNGYITLDFRQPAYGTNQVISYSSNVMPIKIKVMPHGGKNLKTTVRTAQKPRLRN